MCEVYADGNQTDSARHVAHTKELSQGVRKDAQTVSERNLIAQRFMYHTRQFYIVDHGDDYCGVYRLSRVRTKKNNLYCYNQL